MKTACECVDPECAAHPGVAACGALGLIIMHRAAGPDGAGTLMCAGCRDYALESGTHDAGRLGARAKR
jgi:hypothetical protein